MSKCCVSGPLAALALVGYSSIALQAKTDRYAFGGTQAFPGAIVVRPSDAYTPERGYGFEPGPPLEVVTGASGPAAITSLHAFLFSATLPEGDYQVEVVAGNPKDSTEMTIRAEQRRLYFESVKVKEGGLSRCRFVVDVRSPMIAGGDKIRLKPREYSYVNWDNKLTLEFDGPKAAIESIEIIPISHRTTLYLAGDSTVTDQEHEPWCSWGQIVPRFLDSEIVVANYAESGESATSFIGERRWAKVLSVVKPGDYVFFQFGHNDQKDKRAGAGAYTTYTDALQTMVTSAKAHGAFPVLITPMNRYSFDAAGKITNSLGDYPDAVRKLAADDGVPLIDLNAMSKTLYEALGPDQANHVFVHFPANTFPDQPTELKDDTHFQGYGAYELARCVIEGIRMSLPQLAVHLAGDVRSFSPSQPDPVATFHLQPSPGSRAAQVPAQAK